MSSLELKLNPFKGKKAVEAEVVRDNSCENPRFVELHGQALLRNQYDALVELAAQYGKSAEEMYAPRGYDNRIEAENGLVTVLVLEGTNNAGKLIVPAEFSGLRELYCADNQLTELDINACKGLKTLGCSWNRLTKLDVSECKELRDLLCGNNQLTELDVSMCKGLETLRYEDNQFDEQLTGLKVGVCKNLWFYEF